MVVLPPVGRGLHRDNKLREDGVIDRDERGGSGGVGLGQHENYGHGNADHNNRQQRSRDELAKPPVRQDR